MRTHRPQRIAGTLLLPIALLAGCDGIATVCTSEFAVVTVTVVDTLGAPVTDATVTSTLLRTGAILSPTSLALLTAGTYIIVDDGAREPLRNAGDSVGVTARRGTGPSLPATYVIDVPGGCHVHKLSGPDTLSLP
ncbi:MAG: hypothetical protein ABI587_10770 [Gemmatimonadales bacterium]